MKRMIPIQKESVLEKEILDLYNDIEWMNQDLLNKDEYLGKVFLGMLSNQKFDLNKSNPWNYIQTKYEQVNCAYETCNELYNMVKYNTDLENQYKWGKIELIEPITREANKMQPIEMIEKETNDLWFIFNTYSEGRTRYAEMVNERTGTFKRMTYSMLNLNFSFKGFMK